MFTIKARISDVGKYGEDGPIAVFDVSAGTAYEEVTERLTVHELAILIRDLSQALAESVSMLEREQTRLAVESMKVTQATLAARKGKVASRSVE